MTEETSTDETSKADEAEEQDGAAEGPWDIEWIQSVLPHRYPFLLIDRVLEIEPKKRIVAIKNVTIAEEVFQGHFPGHPVMPGVLLVEAMAQAGAVLLLHDREDAATKVLYLMGMDKVRFRRPVVPGDQVRFEIDVLHNRPNHCKLRGRALVEGKLCAEGVVTSATVDR